MELTFDSILNNLAQLAARMQEALSQLPELLSFMPSEVAVALIGFAGILILFRLMGA